ncbi:MAG TPA: GNAT family N-acetyltransferase [Paenirhodobacter sp.]
MHSQLRGATPADYDRIAEIWHASASLPDVGPPVMPSRTELRRRLDCEMAIGWQVTVAVTDAQITGFVAMIPPEAILAELFLSPEWIGLGIGKALLDHAKAAMPMGFSLRTTSANARARHFYRREGLIAIGTAAHPRSGHAMTRYGWRMGDR